MDVRGWLLFLRDWFLVLLIGTVLAGGAAFAVSSVLPKTYEAQTTLLVGQSLTSRNPDYSQLLASQVIAQTYAEVATARPNLESVIAAIGLEMTPEELAQAVEARAPANSTLVIVTASAGDPALAASMSNALAQSLLDIVADSGTGVTIADVEAIDTTIETLNERIATILDSESLTEEQQATLAALRDEVALLRTERSALLEELTGSSNRLSVIEPAITPDEPVSPRIILNTVIGAFLGLVIATLAAYAFESAVRPDVQAKRSTPMAAPLPSLRARSR